MSTNEYNILNSIEEFNSFLNNDLGLILFHKKLCPHCKVMHTVVGKVIAQDPDIVVATVDSEEHPELLKKVGVERVPTLCVVKNGAICAKNTGILNPRETLTLIYNAQTL